MTIQSRVFEALPSGAIIAVSIPPGAEIFIDGQRVIEESSKTPTIVHNVPAGRHIIVFRLIGYLDEIISVDIPQGGYMEVSTRMHLTQQIVNTFLIVQ